ncbi:HSPB (Heat shock 27kDa) associated protein 1 [Seminavis robusta]|uniref:HSPB (Heat shock 27kDa) associated protein 1 n=1 Tax=Seminavis robusta TaxID=568900 RepID=A0A9N8E8E3_9STRA|nr:HSPB (Heat shock 27kDa) associated protein 1 [Seminavis robusta]|eukprot:Sro796_g203780.1 HSPB (Heat shock 27kDa) associated protein 1 (480) ;mRNA; r:31040-32599
MATTVPSSSREPSLLIRGCFWFLIYLLLMSIVAYSGLEELDPNDDLIIHATRSSDLRRRQHHHKQQHPTNKIWSWVKELLFWDLLEEKQTLPPLPNIAKLFFEVHHPPNDHERIQNAIQTLRQEPELPTQPDMPYDVHNCPEDPPQGYPLHWNLMDMLQNWNPSSNNNNDMGPTMVYQSLCIFDGETDLPKAFHYRHHNLPFVMRNLPAVLQTTERWTTPGYLEQLLMEPSRAEKIDAQQPDSGNGTDKQQVISFSEWLAKVNREREDEEEMDTNQTTATTNEAWTFLVTGSLMEEDDGNNRYLFDELPFFDPHSTSAMHSIAVPKPLRGGQTNSGSSDSGSSTIIRCQFDTQGVVQEAYFDEYRNFVANLGGTRRYILANPTECLHMNVFPPEHEYARHTTVDWSTAATDHQNDTIIGKAQANEVILQPGDLLHLPAGWFNFDVTLDDAINVQCRAHAGGEEATKEHFWNACGASAAK